METRLGQGGVRIATAVAILVAFAPADAPAATVRMDSGELVFDAALGEVNTVRIGLSADGSAVEVTDASASTSTGAGCTGGGPPGTVVSCPLPPPSLARVVPFIETGDGDDYVAGVDDDEIGGAFVDAGRGADHVEGGDAVDYLTPGPGADTVRAGADDDVIYAGGGRYAKAHADGADLMIGGDGVDVIDYLGRQDPLTVTLDKRANDGARGEGDTAIAEVLHGGDGEDLLVGGPRDDVIHGEGGTDRVIGLAGDDELADTSLHGHDRLLGGAGDDRLNVLDGSNTLLGGPGADRIVAGRDSDKITGGPGEDRLHGNDGRDRIRGATGNDLVVGGNGDDVVDGGGGRDAVTGGFGEDTLLGGPGPDVIDAAFAFINLEDGRTEENAADAVECGPGSDRAITDRRDTASGCERVDEHRQAG